MRKGEDEHSLDAGLRQQIQLVIELSNQTKRNLRAQDADRMGIEGYGHRVRVKSVRALDDFGDDSLMSAMHAIEISNGDYGGPEIGGNFFSGMEDPHGYNSKGIRSPS